MEQMLSEKNKTLIIIKGAEFRKGRILVSGKTHWRCTNKNCKAKFYTINEKDIIYRDLIHNHDIDSAKLCREKISNSLKRKAEEEISVTPLKVIHEEIKETPEVLQELTLVDIGYIRKNLYNARRAYLPPLPKSVQDVQEALDSMSIKTIQEES